MKESGSDIGQIAEYVARTPDDFTVLAGSATTLFHALCAGCDGAILALASLRARRRACGCMTLVARAAARRGARAAAPADAARALGRRAPTACPASRPRSN